MKNKLKRTLTLLLSFVMIFSMASYVSAAEGKVTLKVSSQSVVVGNEVTVTVSVSGTEKATSASVLFSYGDNFKYVSGEWQINGLLPDYNAKNRLGVIVFKEASDMNGEIFKLVLQANSFAEGAQNISVEVKMKEEGGSFLTYTTEDSIKIETKNLTVTGLSAQNKIYDATTDAVISGGVLEGVIDGDDVKAVFPASGQFAKANVGRNIAVTIDDIVLEGSAKDNYTLTQPSLKADITAVVLKIKADDKSMATGGSLPELTYTITEGKLFGNDKLSGALSTTANGSRVGTFPITHGTLKASSDYQLTFTGGTLTVVDKTPQNIVVSDITAKTYGDEPFTVTVTPDSVSGLTDMEFSSSNPSVAEIDGQGNVTVKAAGSTVITIKQAGNDEYAPFERKQTLIVNKVAVTVTADAKSKKIGMADPELTYTYTGKLIGNDAFTGALSRRSGETVGKYDILQGTLTLGGNYAITYNKAIFEIFDKTPQNVVVSEITEKTYGDEPFTVTVTPDPESKLNAFTFESSSKAVAEISAEGTVTIKGAGETDITVKEAGNTEYAPFTKTQKLVVKKKALTVTALNLDEKTVAFDSEAEDCSIDFEKLTTKVTEKADDASMKVTAGNFVLTGAKAGNYTLTTDTFETTVKNENTATVTVLIENGTVTGEGIYVKGSIAELVASTRGDYYFTGWYIGTEKVSNGKTYRFTVTEDTELIAKTVKIEKNGGGATVVNPTCKVRFITDGGSYIADRTVDKYDCVSAPNAPTRDGFTFTGWYTDKETTKLYNFSNKVTSNLTLFAGWKPIAVRKNYTDVSVSDWFDEAVQYVSAKNLMQGVSETEFAPNAPLTRAMFVTILHRMENTPEAQPSSFTDVANDAWYAKAVSWAKANGIVNGVTDTEFAPDETITREQMAAVLYRYAGVKGYDLTAEGELAYADKKDISDYAASAILWMTNKQIMSGDSDVTFAPKNTATRAQAAAVFMRISEKLK